MLKNKEKGDFMKERILASAPLFKLKIMLASPEMRNFVLACEELAAREEHEAYEAMKRYIDHKDKYKRLCVLKTIFRHPCAAELIPWLEANIASGEEYFSENGLEAVGELGLKINREILISAVERELKAPYAYNPIKALSTLDESEENFRAILALFEKAAGNYQKEFIAEILCEKYLPSRAEELFALFAASNFAKVRIIAARIGKKYGFDLEKLKYDKNGHIRKIAEINYGELDFLRKYMKEYKVEFSENLESAIIINPYKDEHIEIDLDRGTDWKEYTVTFPGTHEHFDESEEAAACIDEFISGGFCTVSCLCGGAWAMSASIASAEVAGLTYEKICEVMLNGEPKHPENVKIEIRGFLPENDCDVTFEEKDGKILIKRLKVSENE